MGSVVAGTLAKKWQIFARAIGVEKKTTVRTRYWGEAKDGSGNDTGSVVAATDGNGRATGDIKD